MGTWRLKAVRNIHLATSISPYRSPSFSETPGTGGRKVLSINYWYCTVTFCCLALRPHRDVLWADQLPHPSITQRMKSAITWWRLLSFVAAAAAEPESCAPMKIAVLGATGGVGKHVVRLALEAGHSVTAIAREPSNIIPSQHPNLHNSKFDMQTRAVDDLADVIRGSDLVLSCLGNRRGEPPVVANGTAMLMAAMAKSAVPRMAMISSIGIGDSWLQLYRLGFGGWIFSAIFATILRSTKNDLTAAETLAIGGPAGLVYGRATPHSRPDGVSVIVVRPAGLSDAPGEGKYDISLANGSVGSSVAREDVARFMLTLASESKYDNGAVSVGGNAPRTGH